MIDEAIGKILGMVMAYGASALGMFVAYVNYRRRIVKADKVMTPAAWGVIALTVLALVGGVLVVKELAQVPMPEPAPESGVGVAPEPEPAPIETAPAEPPENRWPWVGIVVPLAIFLFATVITAGLHRHFAADGH